MLSESHSLQGFLYIVPKNCASIFEKFKDKRKELQTQIWYQIVALFKKNNSSISGFQDRCSIYYKRPLFVKKVSKTQNRTLVSKS